MAWTHSGIIVEKKDGDYYVFASEKFELEEYADEQGKLQDRWLKDANRDLKEDGLYQVGIGYGNGELGWYGAIKYLGKAEWGEEH